MSRDDRQSDENWKVQQDRRIEEHVRKFLADLNARQDQVDPKNQDFGEALHDISDFVDHLAEYVNPSGTEVHQHVGIADHHDTVVQADHGHASDLSLPAVLAVYQVVMKLAEMVNFMDEQKALIGKENLEKIGANIAEMWDRFADGTAQIIEDAKQQMIELVSLDKTQDRVPDEQHRARDAAAQEPHKAKPDQAKPDQAKPDQARPDAPDPEMAALLSKQASELASKAAQIEEQRRKFADSPDQLNAVNEVAKQVEDQTAAKHAAEIQKLLDQRQLQMQQQLSAPPDPNRTR
jgi:hypothetical protein